MRQRACGVVVKGDKVLLMYRKNPQGEEYYTIPGGGVEDGESLEQAVKRELYEECSIDISVGKEIFTLVRENIDSHHHFLCTHINGEPKVHKDSEEYMDNLKGYNIHIPEWMPISQLPSLTMYPIPAKEKLIDYLKKKEDEDLTLLLLMAV